MARTQWNEELLESELKKLTSGLGRFPSVNDLKSLGRSDISNQISKRGGFKEWARRLHMEMKDSDSMTGWNGEDACEALLQSRGFFVERQTTGCHFDMLVHGCLRVDVKTAKFASYGVSSGWFYRMGKVVSADVVLCYRSDKEDYYAFPWFRCPSTNLTITPTGQAHSYFLENADAVLKQMITMRTEEIKQTPSFNYKIKN